MATLRVDIPPEMLRWAFQRAGMGIEQLVKRCPKYPEWEKGEAKPTLKQLEKFANVVHVPVGYLFLSEPPDERTPIPDFRTIGNAPVQHPSPDLLDTIYLCQQRQEWYLEYARENEEDRLPFVGSVDLWSDIQATATSMRTALGFSLEERRQLSRENALRNFMEQADSLGILVMANGVVGSNTHRKLDPNEFRGFALADDLAPLVFINTADTKAAQMFTLAHELAHLWLGRSALSDAGLDAVPSHDIEAWCNRVAAELLVPLSVLCKEYRKDEDLSQEMERLARQFKVSTLVILRRIHDAGNINQNQFREKYQSELARLIALSKGSGGDFHRTLTTRVGKRFARALVVRTLEGKTPYREACHLLGFSKIKTFHAFAEKINDLD